MAKKIEKYSDFKSPENKDGKSNDIVALSKLEDGTYEKIDEPINILQVTGIITDEEEINNLEESFTLDTSVVVKNIKRGEILWLTALLEKTSGSTINSQTLGVLKVRVVDYFYGLNKLNQIKKTK